MNTQRGALLFITPLIMITVILLGVFALDGARLYSLRKEMQSQANAAATAAVDAAQTCGSMEFGESKIFSRALQAASASGFDGEQSDLEVSTGVVVSENGNLRFVRRSNYLESNAVHVSYKRTESISMLLPSSVFGTVDLSVDAVAKKSVIGTFSASGVTAIVGGESDDIAILNSVLGLLLNGGSPYKLSALEVSELNELTVKLEDLLVNVEADTLVNALPVDAGQLAAVLRGVIDGAHPASTLLGDLLRTAGTDLGAVELGSVLQLLGDGAEVSPGSRVPVYDLIISMALNVLEGTLSDPVDIGVDLGGVAELDLALWVGQAPTVVVGPARLKEGGDLSALRDWHTNFESSNIKIFLTVDLLSALGPLANVSLPLVLETGHGQGAFTGANCARGGNNTADLEVAWDTNAAKVRTGILNDDGSVEDANLAVRVLLVRVPLKLDVDVESAGGRQDNPATFNNVGLYEAGKGLATYQKSVGGRVSGVSIDLSIDSRGLLSAVLSILNPVLDLVNTIVLEPLIQLVVNPLLGILGLDLGSMNVKATDAYQTTVLLEGVELQEDN